MTAPNYTDIFGANTVPPSPYGYRTVSLSANTTFNWPERGTINLIADIMDVTATVGSLSMTLPPADQVGPGQNILIRNVGLNSFSVLNAGSGAVGVVAPGAVVYLFVADNTSIAGTWGNVAFGVGTSSVDAAVLQGYGILAINTTLNQSHPVLATASNITIDSTHRAQMVNFTGGVQTCALTAAATIGDNFFTIIRNSGTGTLTIDPSGAELIDGVATFDMQPAESLILFCSGAQWYTVGYGRSLVYNFTQLVKDVSVAGTFTLTANEAANKLLTFTGNPAGAVTIVVPNTVAVYYLLSSISTAQTITVKTAAGTGVALPQSQRIIAISDATNVYSAQSISATSAVSLIDGSVANPSLNFATQTNTGLYKYSVTGLGIAIAGADIAHFVGSSEY
jgi:hypothetical protein